MITRRSFLSLAGLLPLSACRSAPPKNGAQADGNASRPCQRPNILWITCEDMSPQLGAWGDGYARTPNIDRLAGESIRYTRAFATAPVCSPVRSCLISGLYATAMGTANLRSGFPFPEAVKGLPAYLRQAGYFTTNNVKTDYNTGSAKKVIKEAWDQCSNTAHFRHRKPGQPFFAIFNDMVSHQSRTMVWPYAQFKKDVQSDLTAEERHDPDKAPVPPYYPDTPVVRRTVARFYDCVTVMDRHTGRLLAQLEADGLADDTIVFFYSDHGSGMPRHKRALLDSGMHVPLLVRFGKNCRHLAPKAPGSIVDDLVSFVDFPPTLLSLLGLPIPDYMQGQPFLGSAAQKVTPRTAVYGARDRVDEAYDCARSIRTRDWLYIRNYMPHLSYNQPSFFSDQGEIRQEINRLAEEGKLTHPAQLHYAGPTRPIEELYHVKDDPKQLNNLAGAKEHTSLLASLRKRLRDWILDTRDLGFLPEALLAERMGEATPFAMARDSRKYPLAEILDTAELVGQGNEVIPEQIKRLNHDDAAVRYWAALGLKAVGAKTPAVMAVLSEALSDPVPSVQVEAAEALCRLDHETEKCLALLAEKLKGKNLRIALRAARALQLLGEKARPVLPVLREVLKRVRAGRGDENMFLRFSLDTALRKLAGGR